MATLKGALKTSSGDKMYPETSMDKVINLNTTITNLSNRISNVEPYDVGDDYVYSNIDEAMPDVSDYFDSHGVNVCYAVIYDAGPDEDCYYYFRNLGAGYYMFDGYSRGIAYSSGSGWVIEYLPTTYKVQDISMHTVSNATTVDNALTYARIYWVTNNGISKICRSYVNSTGYLYMYRVTDNKILYEGYENGYATYTNSWTKYPFALKDDVMHELINTSSVPSYSSISYFLAACKSYWYTNSGQTKICYGKINNVLQYAFLVNMQITSGSVRLIGVVNGVAILSGTTWTVNKFAAVENIANASSAGTSTGVTISKAGLYAVHFSIDSSSSTISCAGTIMISIPNLTSDTYTTHVYSRNGTSASFYEVTVRYTASTGKLTAMRASLGSSGASYYNYVDDIKLICEY